MNQRISVFPAGAVADAGLLQRLRAWLRRTHDARERARDRRATIELLSQLSDRQLDDIGITRGRIAEAVDRSLAQRPRGAGRRA